MPNGLDCAPAVLCVFKDYVQMGLFTLGTIGGLVTAGLAVRQAQMNHRSRVQTERLERINLMIELEDRIRTSPLSKNAIEMIDYEAGSIADGINSFNYN